MGRPNQTQERLDALLDGRPGEVTDDLAPLLTAAAALRVELAEFELDPEVVDLHLEQALDRPATVVPLPVRTGGGRSGLRRRLAAVALAAALVLVPATAASAASASALPGQALYPVKLAVEQFRLATVQWSPTREAQERAKLAAKRLAELDKLVELRMYKQVPPAIRALDKAVAAARVAVLEAVAEEGRASGLVAAASRLQAVQNASLGELNELKTIVNQLPPANRMAITLAVQQSPVAKPLPPVLPSTAPGPATTAPPNSTGPPDTGRPPQTQPEPTSPPTTQPQPPPPTTSPPPPTTTEPPAPTTTSTPNEPTTTAAPQGTPGEGATAGYGTQGSTAGLGTEGAPPPSTLP